jgi:hypothetical protein
MNASMPTTPATPRAPRLRLTLQPLIVKVYKVAGIVALGAILLGLILYLVNNVFYFFDNSWVRPVILSPSYDKVMAASADLSTAQQALDALEIERDQAAARKAKLERSKAASASFVEQNSAVVEAAGDSLAAVEARRSLQLALLEGQAATDDLAVVERELANLDTSLAAQRGTVERLGSSYYLKARGAKIVVGFVPYENLSSATPGTSLYRCKWGLVNCSEVGTVLSVLDGEVSERHPEKDRMLRGVMIEMQLSDAGAGQDAVLFAGGKPFWIF